MSLNNALGHLAWVIQWIDHFEPDASSPLPLPHPDDIRIVRDDHSFTTDLTSFMQVWVQEGQKDSGIKKEGITIAANNARPPQFRQRQRPPDRKTICNSTRRHLPLPVTPASPNHIMILEAPEDAADGQQFALLVLASNPNALL